MLEWVISAKGVAAQDPVSSLLLGRAAAFVSPSVPGFPVLQSCPRIVSFAAVSRAVVSPEFAS